MSMQRIVVEQQYSLVIPPAEGVIVEVEEDAGIPKDLAHLLMAE